MENSNFNISQRRKILYRKKRIRKITFKTICLIILLFLTYIPIKFISNKKIENSTINKKITTNMNKKTTTICIDPGHGDWDVGAKGTKGSLEKDISLSISLKLGSILEKNDNIKIIYTRTNDSMDYLKTSNDSLKERIKISEIFESDIFISIHCNSNYDLIDSRGIETWYNPNKDESKELATFIQNALVSLKYTDDRGLKTYEKKEDALAVLELNTATPALVELGFLSNLFDEKYLSSEKGQKNIAEALNDALINYINK
ncbi:N-acetylmuramoyl-L-alanine amidase [Clostridium sp.]|uniref:N-acetylmuramoyl-L-alanine amidase family protein n=1 Tax=Clostridium sp. TaxID=1506 RepID=UPI002604786F|nr:N-acetylmuramoyl-L-alanine amidase [Clostridium sp.]